MSKTRVLLLFSFLLAAAIAADTKWTLIPSKEAEEEQKRMPATLNSIINKNRSKQTENMDLPKAAGQQVVKSSDAPTTFTAGDLPSGMTYSSYSSSSSSRLVDGKWVTETTSTEVKPDAQNKLRGTTKKETTIEPLASGPASTVTRTSSSSASSSSSLSSSMSSSSSLSSPFDGDEADVFASSPINDVFRSFSGMNSLFNRPAGGLLIPSSLRVNTFSQPQNQLRFRQATDAEEEREK